MRWRVYLVVGGLLLLLLATAGTTTAVRLHVTSVGHRLTNTLRPAQMSAANLTKAYIDEETGERGYLLTRDTSFLQPYDAGQRAAARAHEQLAGQFAGDPETLRILTAVDDAANQWHGRVTLPEISAFQNGTMTGRALAASVALGRTLFDDLRAQLSRLQQHINDLVTAALQDSSAAQTTANDVTIIAAIAALLLAGAAIWQLRSSFAVPLNRLVTQVRRVAGGDIESFVDVSGPLEVTTVASSVEAMRVRILAESAHSEAAARQVARYEEAERIAHSLGSTVIRQLFTTSLALQSTASRHPAIAAVLGNAIREIDGALKDLQSAIFELTAGPSHQPLSEQILDLVDQLEEGLGTAPEVQLAGSLDSEPIRSVVPDVMAVARNVLGAVVRPAAAIGSSITVTTSDGMLHLLITGGEVDQGAPTLTLADVRERAERLGGSCSVEQSNGSVVVQWHIPIPAESE